ncbi:NAD(P)/FAD-dependent oxidoreductase [Thiomicrorhabdus sp.]|uniref:NAD(P)/FAD-dependent oxidoreductase n=1 Tax=Thiomicrorhabdus sp. TaxID=2039724 RepID=UPI0029C72713|nr:NAD(P)/FAD-dependent oxidoreductase [Thiomicrorhabdus sp.]
MKRRDLLKLGALAGSGLLVGCSGSLGRMTGSSSTARVVVVGGGPGGLSAAHTIKKANPKIEVTLVERNADYSTCFGSNWVLGGITSMEDITFNYRNLAKHQIKFVHDEVIGIDPDAQEITLANHDQPLEYDRLVVSPGISFRWDMVEGHDESTSFKVPHAWKAGYQTMMLKAQISDMPENGTMVMAAPPNPFRCPPGPYERASMIAHYMKKHKPKAKLLILDAKDKFSKQGLFTSGWEEHYGFGSDNAMIEWISKSNGGEVAAIDPNNKIVTTKAGEKIKADVINYIPPQKANTTAVRMGLVNESGWCPVNADSFESTLVANIHVLGDASIASPMPKSGFAANSQGVLCGKAVAALLSGKEPDSAAKMANQCYSLVTPDHGISVAAAYKLDDGKIAKTSGGLYPKDGNFAGEAQKAHGWYLGMAATMFN